MLCKKCGSAFDQADPRQKLCGDCRARYKQQYNHAYYLKNKDTKVFKQRRRAIMIRYNKRRKEREKALKAI